MSDQNKKEIYEFENKEWLSSLDYIIENESEDRVKELLSLLQIHAQKNGIVFQCPGNTAFLNTIAKNEEKPFPGNREIERRIKSIIRWNAMAMVVRANKKEEGIGGHISTYASCATLFEVAFNHFLRGRDDQSGGDIVYFQGHASPGVYARSFLEGRLSEDDLNNFRRELSKKGGLPSYPHPRFMADYWRYPTVSMGLSPIQAIYQARFMKYLEDRELIEAKGQNVWAFLGDGEMDEPESMGALTLASREELDNLIFVINCNLQRLDGPVRGNGKIIQELEAAFKGAKWNVIKVIWGGDWDPLLEKDKSGLLARRMNEVVDGQVQKYTVSSGDYVRKDFFGKYPELEELVENYSDEQLTKLRRGGHDPVKVYNAYKKAVETKEGPTVILAQTIKGYGLGEAGEGKNITHKQKKLNEEELRHFRARFGIPISDEELPDAPFYKPSEDSEEIQYIKERRKSLGGFIPAGEKPIKPLKKISKDPFKQFFESSGDRDVATTMVIVQLMSNLLKDKEIGKLIVPIVPDESRTFGMESLFRQVGIYSHQGQLYEPVDKSSLLYYNEKKDGAILEEGITEAGSMSSFISAGTAGSSYGVNTIPFFIFYSMFGFQRVGDLIWAACDARARGFLIGATSGRSSLPGEGLQHQDGQSHAYALAYPSIKAYDPAYAYELAVIVKKGMEEMYVEQENVIYYLTVMNETYRMPELPAGAEDAVIKGIHRIKTSEKNKENKVHLFGSGAIVNEALTAAEMLENDFAVSADVWSVTSYKELYRDAVETERWNREHPEEEAKTAYIEDTMENEKGHFVAALDYLKVLPLSIAKWLPGTLTALGTDGFGRSDTRRALRDYFAVDADHIALAAVEGLYREEKLGKKEMKEAAKKWLKK
jgi:pyruvate dehydrogenase E1 component